MNQRTISRRVSTTAYDNNKKCHWTVGRGSREKRKISAANRLWKVGIRFLHSRRRHLSHSLSRLNHTLVIAFYNHSRPVHTHGGHVDKGKNQRAKSRKGRHALLRRKAKRSLALLVSACFFCSSSRVVPWKHSL